MECGNNCTLNPVKMVSLWHQCVAGLDSLRKAHVLICEGALIPGCRHMDLCPDVGTCAYARM